MLTPSAIKLEETPKGTKRAAKKAIKKILKGSPEQFKRKMKRYVRKVKRDAKRFCPVDTGTLQTSIRLVSMEDIPKGSFEVARDVTLTHQIIAGGPPFINPNTKHVVDYAQAVHDGVPSKGIPPTPFLTDALAVNKVYYDTMVKEYLDWKQRQWSDRGKTPS